MPGLKTGGFQLSALPRAPSIPKNVGVVDVKAIYDSVKQGLENSEMIRRAPGSMLLADAQTRAATEQAPLKTRGVLAQTEALEQQLPLKTALLAEEASPEMADARRQVLLSKAQPKPLTGAAFLLNRVSELERARDADPANEAVARDLIDARSKLTESQNIATARIQGTAANVAATNTSKEGMASGKNTTQTEISVANNAARAAIEESRDNRIRELADANETMRRELDALKLTSAEKRTEMVINAPAKRTEGGLQHSDNVTKSEEALRVARETLDVAFQNGTEDEIVKATNAFQLATGQREWAQKIFDQYHAERTKKVSDDSALIAAINARKQRGTPVGKPAAPAPALGDSSSGEWTEITTPSGVKVRVRKKP